MKLPLANAGYTNDVDTNGTPALEGNRARVYDYVRKHPGSHLREIKKNLGIGMGDLQYQLYILEKMGLINSMRRGLYKFVFPSGIFGDKQAAILGALSLETQREILLFLSERSDPTQREISEFTKLSAPTIAWHMRRLENEGIIERKKIGKFVSYKLICDAEEVKKFVRNYHPALFETLSSRLTNTFLEISIGGESSDIEKGKEPEQLNSETNQQKNRTGEGQAQ